MINFNYDLLDKVIEFKKLWLLFGANATITIKHPKN